MKGSKTVGEYIKNHLEWEKEISFLRAIALKTSFEETIKWGAPTYTVQGKNVVAIGAFKNYVSLWFFNGSYLKDTQKKLMNAQEGKTKGLRQWRFKSVDDMDKQLILAYLNEAIKNQKEGKTIKISRSKPVVIPPELQKVLNENKELKSLFLEFTNSKQREFSEHITSAKREATKIARLEKIIPMILSGVGLHDKYRNC